MTTQTKQTKQTKQAAYRINHTNSGYAVVRMDGAIAEFIDREEAEEAKKLLEMGRKTEKSYYWLAQ